MNSILAIVALCNIAFFAFSTGIGPIARTIGLTPFHVGAMVGVSGICIMLTSRSWGKRADKRGYRPVMLQGLGLFCLMFTIITVAVIGGLNHWWGASLAFLLLLVSRGGAGSGWSAIQVASQVYVGVSTPAAQRPAAMATLGAAGAFGMIGGPAIAGFGAQYSLSAPILIGLALGLLAIALCFKLPLLAAPVADSTQIQGAQKHSMWSDKRIHWPMIVIFFAMFCVIGVQINTAFYVMDRFAVPISEATPQTGIALTAVGCALVSSQMLTRFTQQRRGKPWHPAAMIAFGAGLSAAAFFIATLVPNIVGLAMSYFVSGFGMGLVFPGVSGLASASVGSHEQGVAMGSVGSAQALGMVLGPIAATGLYLLDPRAPFWVSGIILTTVSAVGFRRGFAPLRPTP